MSDDTPPAAPPVPSRRRRSMFLLAIFAVVLLWRGVVMLAELESLGGGGDDDGEELGVDAGVPPPAKQHHKKKLLGDAEVVEVKSRSGWSPQTGSLVEKRPPRQCLTVNLPVQVFAPVVYMNKNWKRRAYACLVKSGCRQGILEDAEDRRWSRKKSLDVTFLFLNAETLGSLPESAFRQLYFDREGSTYVDVVLGGLALNGNMYSQFEARQTYVKKFGCAMNDLNIQLPIFRLSVLSECLDVKEQAAKSSRLTFSLFSASSRSLEEAPASTLSSSQLVARVGDCTKSGGDRAIVVKNMAKMLLVDKARFSVRAFLLVGSTMPFMVFFRRGYVRVFREGGSSAKATSLEDFQRTLANGRVTGTHFVDTFLKSSMKRIALLLFQAARPGMERRRGTYHLYSLDFLVDDQLRVFLEKSDPYPTLVSQQDSPSDASVMITEMHDLVMELNEEPTAFETMITGDKYGLFELIFSESRETCEGTLYNPCHQFHDYNAKPLAKANKKISTAHNAANREHHEETRVRKKLDEEKKAKCKEKGLSFESKACDKYAKQLEDDLFEQLFAEHEKDWNPNAFKMAKSGEVFPWEIV